MECTLGFALSGLCSIDVLSDGAVDLSTNTLAGVWSVVLTSGLPGMDFDVLVDVFAGVITVKFPMSAPLEGSSCDTEFDWRPMAGLDCNPNLQARMPSYQV